MIFVALDKLYHGFNKILPVSVLHLFYDQDRVLPAKQ